MHGAALCVLAMPQCCSHQPLERATCCNFHGLGCLAYCLQYRPQSPDPAQALCVPMSAGLLRICLKAVPNSQGNVVSLLLLQGHEDLRQDERVMQLFGLVNTMLANDRTTAERDLSIARYAVIPLSPNSGLIGWVSRI